MICALEEAPFKEGALIKSNTDKEYELCEACLEEKEINYV